MTTHDNDRLFDQALRAEGRGEWAEAISIYEQLHADLPGQEAEYARNCALRIRQLQEMSRMASALNLQAATGNTDSKAGEGNSAVRGVRLLRSAQGSLVGALFLVLWDAALSGSFLMSIWICPLWFLVSVGENATRRRGWRIALVRIAIPAITLAVVLANNSLQLRIAEANAEHIIKACQHYRVAHGDYPTQLEELVPDYLDSVPPAKYCVMWGNFVYWSRAGFHLLMWYQVPPYGRKHYDFDRAQFGYLD